MADDGGAQWGNIPGSHLNVVRFAQAAKRFGDGGGGYEDIDAILEDRFMRQFALEEAVKAGVFLGCSTPAHITETAQAFFDFVKGNDNG